MRTTKLTVAALAACLLVACSPTPAESPTPSPTETTTTAAPTPTPTPTESPSSTPSPSPTSAESFPTPPTAAGEEELAIRQALMDYYAVMDKFAADPTLTDLTETQYVTTGEEAGMIVKALNELRENGHVATGGRSFHDMRVGEPEVNSEDVTVVTVTYCQDQSRVRVLDAETREDTGLHPVPFVDVVATLELGLDDKWRVAMIRDQEVESC